MPLILFCLFSFIFVPPLPAVEARLNPFGDRYWTKIGNVPLSPNLTFDGYALNLDYSLHLMAVDLYQAPGTPVFSVIDGVPSLPLKMKSAKDPWITTIQITRADGIMTYYMHLDPDSIPPAVWENIKRRTALPKGTQLGRLIKHELLHSHLHFGIADCRRRVRLNPLPYLDLTDTESPQVFEILAAPASPSNSHLLSGSVHLAASIADYLDGSSAAYPPNRVEYEIIPERGLSAPATQSLRGVVFDSTEMPARKDSENIFCEDFLAYDAYDATLGNGLYRADIQRWRKNNIFGYHIALTAIHPEALEGYSNWLHLYPGPWKTDACDQNGHRLYPDGNYQIRVKATDAFGNVGTREETFIIRNIECAKEHESKPQP